MCPLNSPAHCPPGCCSRICCPNWLAQSAAGPPAEANSLAHPKGLEVVHYPAQLKRLLCDRGCR